MDTDSYIEPYDQSVDVQTQTGTRAQRDLFGELGVIDNTVIQRLRYLQPREVIFIPRRFEQVHRRVPIPYVAGIEERCTEQLPHDGETELEVRF